MTSRIPIRFIISSFALIASMAHPALAGEIEDFKSGLNAFKAGKYQEAVEHFKKYTRGRKPDPRSTYYLALANMHAKNGPRAKQLFEYIVSNFPTSDEASHSRKALTRWGVGPITKDESPPDAKKASRTDEVKLGRYQDKRLVHSDKEYKDEYAKLPLKTSVGMHYVNGKYMVPVEINGKKLEMHYTNEWETALSFDDLKKVGISPPTRKPDDVDSDEDTKKETKKWNETYKLTLGSMTRKIPVSVYDKRDEVPQMGRAFFEDLVINSQGYTLILEKKQTEIAGKKETQAQYKSEYAKLPDTADIRFTSGDQGHMMVRAQINGKSMDCMFDTGASGFFGTQHLTAMGMKVPTRKPDSYTRGWAGRPVPIWNMEALVKIGPIERKIPIAASPSWTQPPLLGQEFLRDYQYSIDRQAGVMKLTKKTAKSKDSERPINKLYDINCKVENDREYVTLIVNGQSIPDVLIDTGASMTIISSAAARSAGISTMGARTSYGGGVGGMIAFKDVYVNAQLGPINRSNFLVKIGGKAGCAIGQDFMSGWRFTVDRDKKLLRFFH